VDRAVVALEILAEDAEDADSVAQDALESRCGGIVEGRIETTEAGYEISCAIVEPVDVAYAAMEIRHAGHGDHAPAERFEFCALRARSRFQIPQGSEVIAGELIAQRPGG
jgi:hypothetical protein